MRNRPKGRVHTLRGGAIGVGEKSTGGGRKGELSGRRKKKKIHRPNGDTTAVSPTRQGKKKIGRKEIDLKPWKKARGGKKGEGVPQRRASSFKTVREAEKRVGKKQGLRICGPSDSVLKKN